MKSKYPNQIDTPSEVPIVRDNITEITSDIINSLRSAIIQIEKTLGVNPQGDIGQTVGQRISSVIDSSGNLKPEAIDKAGIIFGPIFDDQVADSAAIGEHKLKLNFPTQVLQSEISSVSSLISAIQKEIDVISSKISAHISSEAINRHKAKAITVDSILKVESATGIKTFDGDTLQNTLKDLVEGHFNYNGSLISSGNNSHSANQIYFDNSNVSSAIISGSVQGAIEEIADGNSKLISENLSYLTKNGISRYGRTYDLYSSSALEETIVLNSTVSFSYSSASTSTIFFDTSPDILKNISKFDILTISGATNELDNRSFYIEEATDDGLGKLTSVKIYGRLYGSSSGIASAKITKNNFKYLNQNGLNSTYRLRNYYSNTPDVVVANPNAATIASFGIRPDLLTATNDSFSISIDDYSPITISCYNSSLGNLQTIESIIDKINEQLSLNHISAFAYKLRTKNGFELAISHVLPNFSGDIKNRTITISEATSNNGTDILGISHVVDIKTQGSYGNSVFINGKLFRDLEKIITLSKNDVGFGSGTPRLTSYTNDFLSKDIRSGDFVIISGSTITADDGLFVVKTITNSEIILDAPYGFSFSGALDTISSVIFTRCSAPISELNFEEVDGGSGLGLIDIFATDDSEIFYSKRAEITNALSSIGFYAAVIDISKDFISTGESYILKVGTDGMAYLEDSVGNIGEKLFIIESTIATSVKRDGIFKIKSPSGASYVTIRAISTAPPTSALECTIYGGKEVASSMIHLSRCLFSNATGRIYGTSGSGGIPSILDKRNFGTIDIEQICPSFVEKNIEGPRGELRAAGIISGCGITNKASGSDSGGTYITFDVFPGVYISNGIRKEFAGITGLKTYKVEFSYICLNEYGEIEIGEVIYGGPTSYLVSPFLNRSIAYLGYLDTDSNLTDLRFFLNTLDMKVATQIIVGKSTSLAHFTDIQSAINYSELFYSINYGKESLSDAYNPTILIREGQYIISEPIVIKRDITIVGSGKNTVLKRGDDLSNPWVSNVPDPNSAIFIIGDGPSLGSSSGTYSSFQFGITIKNLTYRSSDLPTGSCTAFCIFQGQISSSIRPPTISFENIFAYGTNKRDSDSSIKEYFLFCGRIDKLTEIETAQQGTYNIFVSSNYFNRIGAYHSGASGIEENIIIELSMQVGSVSGTPIVVKDIVITSNICTGVAPTASSESASILRTTMQGGTISGIIEASNIVRTGL
jgi:hypothetical protein